MQSSAVVVVAAVCVRVHDGHPIDDVCMIEQCGITIVRNEQQQHRHRHKFLDMRLPLNHFGRKDTTFS